jgi:hypothetical protein
MVDHPKFFSLAINRGSNTVPVQPSTHVLYRAIYIGERDSIDTRREGALEVYLNFSNLHCKKRLAVFPSPLAGRE